MNAQQKKDAKAIAQNIRSHLQRIADLASELGALRDDLDTLTNDVEADWDLRSEKWQEGENGQKARERIDALQEAWQAMDEHVSALEQMDLEDVLEPIARATA